MFPLKILQTFSRPSVFILVFFILGIVFVFRSKGRKIGKVLLIATVLIYYVFSITPIADLILLPLENQCKPLEKTDSVETIVLLTGGLRGIDLPVTSTLGESTLFRTIEAIRIYLKADKGTKIIVSGTNKEAVAIIEFLENFNIPKEDIVLEGESKSTYDSAKTVKDMIKEKPFFLVTSAYHMPRSVYIFKKFEMNPIPAPCDYMVDFQNKELLLLDFFPQPVNLKKVDLAFHEYFGILFYRFLK